MNDKLEQMKFDNEIIANKFSISFSTLFSRCDSTHQSSSQITSCNKNKSHIEIYIQTTVIIAKRY